MPASTTFGNANRLSMTTRAADGEVRVQQRQPVDVVERQDAHHAVGGGEAQVADDRARRWRRSCRCVSITPRGSPGAAGGVDDCRQVGVAGPPVTGSSAHCVDAHRAAVNWQPGVRRCGAPTPRTRAGLPPRRPSARPARAVGCIDDRHTRRAVGDRAPPAGRCADPPGSGTATAPAFIAPRYAATISALLSSATTTRSPRGRRHSGAAAGWRTGCASAVELARTSPADRARSAPTASGVRPRAIVRGARWTSMIRVALIAVRRRRSTTRADDRGTPSAADSGCRMK